MAYSWRIEQAAVEQLILFPSAIVYKAYLSELNRKQVPYEVIDCRNNQDGSVRAIIRKCYNQNDYLSSFNRALQNPPVSPQTGISSEQE